MLKYWRRLLWLSMLGVMLLAACDTAGNGTAITGMKESATKQPTAIVTASQGQKVSTISFTVTGGMRGSYTLNTPLVTSKLRHGHREFTIDIESGDRSIFLAFYGYNGPGSYTLAGQENGGDVRIDFGRGATAWDLPVQEGDSCALNVTGEVPTRQNGIDRMSGRFSCPELLATGGGARRTIAVSNGRFDLFIIVES